MSLAQSSGQHCAAIVSVLGETTSCFHGNLGRVDSTASRESSTNKKDVLVCVYFTYVGVNDGRLWETFILGEFLYH